MAKCRNCGNIFELKVTKGVTVQEYFESGSALCSNCGCAQLNIKSSPPVAVKRPLPIKQGDKKYGLW